MRTTLESPAVLAERVGKTFLDHGRRTQAVAGLDLEVKAGEFVSIIGPSGCGKSTLLRLVGGLITADRGELLVHGSSPVEGRRAKRFGFVPQSPALLPWRTVRENLTLLPGLNRGQGRGPVADDEIDDLLQSVGLAPFADSLPAELSGGMQQRVSLIRAFALRPPILLMDEPFAALDEITRSDMRFLLLDLWRDTRATVLFVTHSIEEAVLLSDRVIVLTNRPGRVSAELDIDLSRPRHHGVEDADDFHHHTAELRSALNLAAAGGGPDAGWMALG
ncbi:MAG: ABC transporter ATP-binding protein [Actinomycetia bacterium]|nr:ABC transporter ATP-binding protein [Actinomycetes bacterium]